MQRWRDPYHGIAPLSDIIEYLVAHGAYVEAARIATERGELRRAIALYERVWRFVDALPLALALGDRGAGRAPGAGRQPAARAPPRSPTAPRARRRAGRGRRGVRRPRPPLRGGRAPPSARGDWPRAAALYRRASAPLDEARARVRAGELREAGLLYERLVAQGSSDEAAAARLALGRLLGRLGRHEEAARHLQAAGAHARAADRRAARAVRAAAGARASAAPPPRWWSGCARTSRRCRARPRSSSRSRRPRRRPPRATACCRRSAAPAPRPPSRAGSRSAGCWAAAPPAASTRRSTRCWAARSRSSCCSSAARPADPERQAYLRFAREAEAAGPPAPPEHRRAARRAAGVGPVRVRADGRAARWPTGSRPPGRCRPPRAGGWRWICWRRWARRTSAASSTATSSPPTSSSTPPATRSSATSAARTSPTSARRRPGGFLGTLAYMSPEQISGAPIGAAADLYALGVTLFEALTGRPPFLGPDLVGAAPGRGAAAADRRCAPRSAPAHDQTLLRALAKAPADRFGSAARWRRPSRPGRSRRRAAAAAAPRRDPRDARPRRERGREPPAAAGQRRGARALAHARARLVVRRDTRTARNVLIEERAQPLDEAALDRLRNIAAAGGPLVQRVLRLSDDRRAIWYEAIAGSAVPLAIGSTARRNGAPALAPRSRRCPPAPRARVARTPARPGRAGRARARRRRSVREQLGHEQRRRARHRRAEHDADADARARGRRCCARWPGLDMKPSPPPRRE